jgi:gliding motility-associated-like protein
MFSPKNADIGTRYMWDFGDGYFSNEPNPTHTYTEAGTYPVSLRVTSIINEKTNTHTSKNLITGFPAPEVNFELMQNQETLDNKEVTFIDHSIDATEWSWLFGDGNVSIEKNPNHKYSDIGNYNVQLIGKNSYGCADTAIGFVSILGSNYSTKLYAPTAFSPNGDGVNDEFRPLMVGENLKYDLAIYDRNGAVIFQSKDINTAWNGKIGDGEQAPFGTYIWLIIIQDEFGKETKQLGQVTVIK